MRVLRSLLCVFVLVSMAGTTWAEWRPIDPRGIDGSVFVCGSGSIPEEALSGFLRASRRAGDRMLVLDASCKADTIERLLTVWRRELGGSFEVRRASSDGALSSFDAYGGIWIAGDSSHKSFASDEFRSEVAKLLKRGGALGFSDGPIQLAESFLPSAVVGSSSELDKLVERQKKFPFSLGLVVPPETMLHVRGRRVHVVGAASVEARFSASKTQPSRVVELDPGSTEDLTTLRRMAILHQGPVVPPKEVRQPIVKSGTLMIVGGGGMPAGLVERFVAAAGGKEAHIVVIPISSPDPLPRRNWLAQACRSLGVSSVTVLKGRTPAAVGEEEPMSALKRATGIWFGGGRQWRFIDAYEGTPAAELMHDVLKRGGVIGGSSAGASIQGQYMARGNPLGPRNIMAPGYERGLDFLGGVAIDQHFTQRRRFKDLSSLVDRHPQFLGIGIDESTALVVQGQIAEVVGRHRVCFYDRRKPKPESGPDFESVPSGGRYDLVERKVVKDKSDE